MNARDLFLMEDLDAAREFKKQSVDCLNAAVKADAAGEALLAHRLLDEAEFHNRNALMALPCLTHTVH